MLSSKRFFVALISGFLCGLICFGLATSSPGDLPTAAAWQIIFSRTLIGFAIGISILRIHWSIHGILIGCFFSLPLAFSGLMAPDNPMYSKASMFIMTVVLGMIYGFLIELITSVIFKAKIKAIAKSNL